MGGWQELLGSVATGQFGQSAGGQTDEAYRLVSDGAQGARSVLGRRLMRVCFGWTSRTEDELADQAEEVTVFVPVQIDIDVDTFKIRDAFVWNINGTNLPLPGGATRPISGLRFSKLTQPTALFNSQRN